MTLQALEKSKQLKKLADALLESDILLPELEKMGTVVFTGSYALDLMVWPDIDLQVILKNTKNPVHQFCELAERLLAHDKVKSVKLLHFNKAKKSVYPEGMVAIPRLMPIDGVVWRFDIWALNEEELLKNKAFMQNIQKQLTPELKEMIVRLKYRLMGPEGKVQKQASYTLYKAIFEEGIKNEADLVALMTKKGFVWYESGLSRSS